MLQDLQDAIPFPVLEKSNLHYNWQGITLLGVIGKLERRVI